MLIERVQLFIKKGENLGSVFDRLAKIHPHKVAITQPDGFLLAPGTSLNFVEVNALIAKASALLAPLCQNSARIVLRGPNGYDFFMLALAISRSGGVVVPVNPQMRDDEVDYVVHDARGHLLEIPDFATTFRQTNNFTPFPPSTAKSDDAAAILYTSGTTGRPKGAVLTHRALLEQCSRLVLLHLLPGLDELVAALPVAHIMGFSLLLGAAFSGAKVYFLPHFRPGPVLDAIEQRSATAFIGVPAMYRILLEAGAESRHLKSIRLWISAADKMPPDLASRFKRMGSSLYSRRLKRGVGEAIFVDGYGMVELAGVVAAKVSLPYNPFGEGGALGFALPPFELRVADEQGREVAIGAIGELIVRGPGTLKAYHENQQATQEIYTPEGWMRTGDLMRRERFGLFSFVGRNKEVIKSGGYSVFPGEIEHALRAHPAVSDAAAIGRPDPIKGEIPVAFVELVPEAAISSQDLLAHAKGLLSDYKVPNEITILERLPRTGTGKVAKPELRRQFIHVLGGS